MLSADTGMTKTAHGIMFKQREIVLVPFPFSDLSSSKRRPVLIVSNDRYNASYNEVVVCVITSNLFSDEYSLPPSNNELEYGMLPVSSVVRIHKLFTVDKNLILRKFSLVRSSFFGRVLESLTLLFDQNTPEIKE